MLCRWMGQAPRETLVCWRLVCSVYGHDVGRRTGHPKSLSARRTGGGGTQPCAGCARQSFLLFTLVLPLFPHFSSPCWGTQRRCTRNPYFMILGASLFVENGYFDASLALGIFGFSPQVQPISPFFRGGRPVQIPDPPPSRPPKIFEPVFLQIEILGKMGGAIGAEHFFAAMRHALELLNTPMCVRSKCSVRIGDFGSTPGGGGVLILLFHQAISPFERQISKTRRYTNVVCCEVLCSRRLARRAAIQMSFVVK